MASDALPESGNLGFVDMQSALGWVQRNIANFGGDASKVTIFGQSSGGTAVFALLASPASRSLFSRAMSLSGSPNITMDRATQRAQHAHDAQRRDGDADLRALEPAEDDDEEVAPW